MIPNAMQLHVVTAETVGAPIALVGRRPAAEAFIQQVWQKAPEGHFGLAFPTDSGFTDGEPLALPTEVRGLLQTSPRNVIEVTSGQAYVIVGTYHPERDLSILCFGFSPHGIKLTVDDRALQLLGSRSLKALDAITSSFDALFELTQNKNFQVAKRNYLRGAPFLRPVGAKELLRS